MPYQDLIVKKNYHIMGGEFQFMCFPQSLLSKNDVENIFEDGFNEVRRIQDKLTDFKESPFNEINKNAGIKPVKVDEEIMNLIIKSNELSQKSAGLFDISFASVGHFWREYSALGQKIPNDILKEQKELIDYKKIIIDKKMQSIYLPHPKMRIGLGGIGKGYAVDRVYHFFLKNGLTNFYVNGAGDLRVHSRTDAPRAWRIGIRNPLSPKRIKNVGIIQLTNGAIASSGGYINNNSGDSSDHHIVHPKLGRSMTTIIGSTILADDALTADTAATIVMNMDVSSALNYLNKENLSGIIFSSKGESFLSQKALKNFSLPLQARSTN